MSDSTEEKKPRATLDPESIARMEAMALRQEEARVAAAANKPAAAAGDGDEEDEDDHNPGEVAAAAAAHVHSSEEKEHLLHVNITDAVIELNNLRIFTLSEINLEQFSQCTTLELRKNLVHNLQPFPEHLRRNLTALDFFDNKIKKIGPYFSKGDSEAFLTSKLARVQPPLATTCEFFALRKLDLSYNQIKEIKGLDDLAPTLEELYLVENRLKKIEGLSKLTKLTLLELGGNNIREVGNGLDTLVNLEQLWIGKNKIASIGTGFQKLAKLKSLSMQANRLTSLDVDVAFAPGCNMELIEVYLSENGLTEIDGLRQLRNLELLDVSTNPIPSLYKAQKERTAGAAPDPDDEPDADFAAPGTELTVAHFPKLLEFWLTDGKLDEWREVEAVLAPFAATLKTVYLERNPIERDRRYRDKVFQALPFVDQIDSWPVVNKNDLESDRATRR
jgi:protein phosphatase 1 regulatory subunit 7